MSVTIKRLINNEWRDIPVETYKGCSTNECLMSFDGKDIVCEVKTDKGIGYFCGDEKWLRIMQDKGAALLCRDAALFYPERKEMLMRVIDVFGECTEAREERIAIMTAENVSLRDAQAYCNSKPDLYGIQTELQLS